MTVDPRRTCLYVPPEIRGPKLNLFNRIADALVRLGGRPPVRGDVAGLEKIDGDTIPIVGCTPALRPLIDEWVARRREWIYWDRGYCRRVYNTYLSRGDDGGMYRWHVGRYQMGAVRPELPNDRWTRLKTEVEPWRRDGRHVVIAVPTPTYAKFHCVEGWTDRTIRALSLVTKRQLVVRDKETKRSLQEDLEGAHALVSHGSNAAVEAVFLGCPVFVDPCSAAALVGRTDLKEIETPAYPDRDPWLRSLAYSQFNERELVDGTLWRLIT